MENIILHFNIGILIYFVALSSWYLLILFAAFPDMINAYQESKYGNLDRLMQKCTVPVTVIIPAFNEEKRILNSLYSLLQNNYANLRIIVVNDGSTDNMLHLLTQEFSLIEIPLVINQTLKASEIRHYYQSKRYENLMVIDKAHGPANNGADCHNAGLNAAVTPIVITLDADTVVEPNAIVNILYSFLSHKHCVSVGGSVYISNDNPIEHGRLLTKLMPKKFIPTLQCIEYFRSFTYARSGLNSLSGALCYPGAFSLFETQALKEVGGFDSVNFSYDAEIIIKLHHKMRQLHYPTHVRFISNAAAWTNVPQTLRTFWRQRNHWQRGMLLSIYKHKAMMFNPKYGIVGLVTFPAYVFFDTLGPVIEFLSYLLLGISLYLGIVSWPVVGWYFLLAWGYILLLTMASFYLSLMTFKTFNRFPDLIRTLWLVSIEMLGFRQFRAACCFYSTFQFMVNRLLGKNL